MSYRFEEDVRAALSVAADESASPRERAEMLMEIAMGLQNRPKTPEQLIAAVDLYDKALSVLPEGEALLAARIRARKATALQAIPEDGADCLEQARALYEEILAVLAHGTAEECAEAEMNYGLVLQSLAGEGRARLTDAIAAYQRALRVFDRKHPVEFAILQNNLATAFLAIPMSDERAKMREAMAVQSFEDGLTAVNLIDHPREYAMLQNNLGNALQYASSAHTLENNLRALEAYEEALKVRTARDAPLEYANTIANKANCLWNLPDDENRGGDGFDNLRAARECYREARTIFADHGDMEKARMISDALSQIDREMLDANVG
jgi:tetratricopeptide (TPR) repeat protein